MKYFKPLILAFLFSYCSKEIKQNESVTFFTEYKIPQSQQYSKDPTQYVEIKNVTNIRFQFKFDSSAIYTTQNPANQADINKLYGFADCVSPTQNYSIPPHQINSARLGWAWLGNKLRLYAYSYADSVRQSVEITTVDIGGVYTATIAVTAGEYMFNVDEKTTSLPRKCAAGTINGYKLFPYFGGDEAAPHDVRIWIRDL